MITLYVDAARDIHTGQTAAGTVIIIDKIQSQQKAALPITQDNHEAEFCALIWALQQLPKKIDILKIYSDSQILIDAIDKQYAKHYQPFVDNIIKLLSPYPLVLNQWLPEKENLGAHHLALQALQQHKLSQ